MRDEERHGRGSCSGRAAPLLPPPVELTSAILLSLRERAALGTRLLRRLRRRGGAAVEVVGALDASGAGEEDRAVEAPQPWRDESVVS